jgi:hypothetical protein
MRHETLEGFIDALNNNMMKDRIFIRPLSDTVDFARVWDELPNGNNGNEQAYVVYFIKIPKQEYVGAVLVMGSNDLHAFVKIPHRKKGYLTCAMRDWILPHLFHIEGREFQRVTFEDYKVVKSILDLGFEIDKENEAVITKEKVKTKNNLNGSNTLLDDDELQSIRKRIYQAAGLLQMVQDQLEMAYAESGEFTEVIDEIKELFGTTEDIIFNNK